MNTLPFTHLRSIRFSTRLHLSAVKLNRCLRSYRLPRPPRPPRPAMHQRTNPAPITPPLLSLLCALALLLLLLPLLLFPSFASAPRASRRFGGRLTASHSILWELRNQPGTQRRRERI